LFIFDSVPSGNTIPLIFLLFFIVNDRVSATITYNKGNKGHPCRTPLVRGNASDKKPLVKILLLVLDNFNPVNKLFSKPKLLKTFDEVIPIDSIKSFALLDTNNG
jgi:hypothetical protein